MPPASTNPVLWDQSRLADPHHQPDKAQRVRTMFDAIAPTYERVNRWLSLGRDGYWRRRAVALADVRPTDCVLDAACGTGDFARVFAAAGPKQVVGFDFSSRMLELAVARPVQTVSWCRADAQRLPFGDQTFDVVSCAFGVRNFQDLAAGLREFHRILRPGGRAIILEFSIPSSKLLGGAYRFYFRNVLPRLATWISHDRTGGYQYLPNSVATFLNGAAMRRVLLDSGFSRCDARRLTAGIVTVYRARKD